MSQGFECESCRSEYRDNEECTCYHLLEYEPYPFIPREMNAEEFTYTQKVNWVELQCADGVPTTDKDSISNFYIKTCTDTTLSFKERLLLP